MPASLLAGVLLLAQLGENPNDVAKRVGRVGIHVDKRGGAMVIDEVSAGTSAEALGLHIGDQILRIDFDNTESMSESSVEGSLRGLHGTKVMLTILPRGAMVPRTVEVLRDIRTYGGANAGIVGDQVETVKSDETAKRKALEVKVESVEILSGPHDQESMLAAFGRGTADVATCVGAVGPMLPNDLEALEVVFTFRKDGTISVKTLPASADAASCLGKKSVGWKVPKAGKEPTGAKVRYILTR